MHDMNWLVGFDIDSDSVGALRLGGWLHDRGGGDVQGVHAVTTPSAGFHNFPGAGADLEAIERDARRFLEAHGVDGAFTGADTRLGTPEGVIAEALRERKFDALIIGRAAGVDDPAIIRVGAVARRILRNLEVPVLVAPPGLRESRLGVGPIVIAVRPADDCLEAVRFGRRLAEHLRVPARLVHVVELDARASTLGALALQPRDPGMASSDVVAAPDLDDVRAELSAWCERHGFADLPLDLCRGARATALVAAARDLDATMLVCGSRELSLIQRLWHASTGSELAALTDRPLAVVPPRDAS